MDYIRVKEAAKRWGYAEGTIRAWCRDGKISLTLRPKKEGGEWLIPADAPCPKAIKGGK